MRADKAAAAAVAFFSFCLASSAIYILNDIADRHQDRLHPLKRRRPIAAGRLSVFIGSVAAVILMALSIGLAGALNVWTVSLTGLFLLSSLSYTVVFKKIILLDVMVLALGFVIRAIAGAAAIHVPVSPWLIACTFFLAVFLTFCKRFYEFSDLGPKASQHRQVLAVYTRRSLALAIWTSAFLTLAAYSAYTVFPVFAPRTFHTSRLPLTIPFVILGLLRYGWMMKKMKKTGTPTEALLTDWRLLGIVAAWLISLFVLVIGETSF
ncbi:MAG: UbiA prenyltransferase family protein [Lentisphaeria bacterium]|nr:UbiA prenyltransferase family protein [Lentisphaeria bacterium]